ncbi:MAG: radical SAM protein [Candidatus Kapabacteria bacterium]|nr:radical SAM protein [Candidatus Kapabacteria bacterium]
MPRDDQEIHLTHFFKGGIISGKTHKPPLRKGAFGIFPLSQRETNGVSLNSYSSALRTLKKIFSSANVESITFTGGEPLLAERFSELILFCRMKKASVSIITNGISDKPNQYKELVSLGVSIFTLPLHSYLSDVHDYMVRKKGALERVLNSIKTLQTLNASIIIDIVLTKINIGHLRQTIEYLQSLGINGIMLTRYNIGGEGLKHSNELIPSLEELKAGFSAANQAAKDLKMNITSNVCTPLCILNPNDYDTIPTFACAADIKRMPVTFDIKGNMRICNHSPRVIGNIFEEKLGKLLNNDYVRSWKEIKPEYCMNCEIYYDCNGGCRAASEQTGKGLSAPDPIIEHYLKNLNY